MKKYLLLSILPLMMLAACSGSETTSSDSQGNSFSSATPESGDSSAVSSNIASSSQTPTSDSSPASSEASSYSDEASSSEPAPTAWSEADLASMKTAFAPLSDVVLPFPEGLTASYTNDSSATEFMISDLECDGYDMLDTYSLQLEDAGFIYVGGDNYDDYDGLYYLYQYCVPDSLKAITVDISYSGFGYSTAFFAITAFYDEEGGMYIDEAFPFARIETELGVTNSKDAIPSFDTLSEYGYWTYYYEGILFVEGFYEYDAANDSSNNVYGKYVEKLQALGYTVTADSYYQNMATAVSATLGYELSIDIYEGNFILGVTYNGPSEEPTPSEPETGDKSYEILPDKFPGSYEDGSFTADGVGTFGYTYVQYNGSKIQFRSANGGQDPGALWNQTSLGTIASIVVEGEGGGYYGVLSLYVSTSLISDVTSATEVEYSLNGTNYTYNVTGNYGYFYLTNEAQSYASKNISITINYSVA